MLLALGEFSIQKQYLEKVEGHLLSRRVQEKRA